MSGPQPDSKQELVSIQLLRALASMLVLLTHLQIKEVQYGDPGALIWQNFEIGVIGVDIFFVLSGFIIFYVAGRIPQGLASAARFMKHRFIRVLPVYWILSCIALTVYLVRPDLVNRSGVNQSTDLLASFLLYPTRDKLLIQNGWTLSYEFLFYLVFCLAILLIATARRRVAWTAGAAVFAVTLGLLIEPSSTFARFATHSLVLEFGMGVVIGYALASPESRRIPLAGGAVILLTGGVLITLLALFPDMLTQLPRGVRFGLPSAMLVFGAVSMESKIGSLRSLKIFGDSSYSLYLLHVLSLPAIGIVWRKLGLTGPLANFCLLLLLFGISVAASILVFRHIEVPVTRALRRRFG